MKIYKAAIIGLGPSGLLVNKLIYDNSKSEIIAFENTDINKRNNFFGFWLTDWMKPFESLVEKKWSNWIIANDEKSVTHNDNNHPYCVISFKKWKDYCLDTANKLELVNKKVIKYDPVENFYKIVTEDKREYYAERIYDSRHTKEKKDELIQHFFGINITTPEKKFNKNILTLMNFTKEDNILHFIYVLPFTENKALIESTVFSKNILNENWYREKISDYLNKLNINQFQETSIEKGTIPMFFSPDKPSKDPNIINIGIRGGACKSSTGYAFSFLIKQIQLLKSSKKNKVHVHNFIEQNMDNIFIKYLKNNSENGNSFLELANKLSGAEFQSFMMGQSTFLTKFKIIKSMPKIPFIKALISK